MNRRTIIKLLGVMPVSWWLGRASAQGKPTLKFSELYGKVTVRGPGAAALVMAVGARRGFAPVTMVIAGMLVGMTASAIATAVTLARGEYLLSLVIWNGGSLVQQDWSGVAALALVLAAGGAGAALIAKPLRVLSLGAPGAAGLGLNVGLVRLAAMALAVALAAAVSAELGLIGFVGPAAPALALAPQARLPSTPLPRDSSSWPAPVPTAPWRAAAGPSRPLRPAPRP